LTCEKVRKWTNLSRYLVEKYCYNQSKEKQARPHFYNNLLILG